MRTVKLNGNSFVIRETCKELTIDRFMQFQKYLVSDSGIGSTMADVDNHFNKLDSLISNNMISEAAMERYNLHFNLYTMLNGLNIESLSFACFIDAINGKKIEDYSEANMIEVIKDLGTMGLTYEMVSDILEGLKKNSILI